MVDSDVCHLTKEDGNQIVLEQSLRKQKVAAGTMFRHLICFLRKDLSGLKDCNRKMMDGKQFKFQ